MLKPVPSDVRCRIPVPADLKRDALGSSTVVRRGQSGHADKGSTTTKSRPSRRVLVPARKTKAVRGEWRRGRTPPTSPRPTRSRPPDTLAGVAPLAAAAIGRTPKVGEPPGFHYDLRIGVQYGIERDVVLAGIDVAKRQPGQRSELSGACGLIDVESDCLRIDSVFDIGQRQPRSVDVGDQPSAHPPHAAVKSKRHQTGERRARPLRYRRKNEAAVGDGRGQQHIPRRTAPKIVSGGMRQTNPAISGNAPGRPTPLETRPMTSQDFIGNPSRGAATRSMMPSASPDRMKKPTVTKGRA
jgi:hypothetical protein